MEYIFLLIAFLAFLAFVVEVAAIALKMTGMKLEKARFQSLSALTGTGFTTKESELITRHGFRRKVIMSLMIIGHIGLALSVSTIIKVFWSSNRFSIAYFVLILVFIFVFYRIVSNRWLIKKIDKHIEKQLFKTTQLYKKPIEEVLKLGEEYGVVEIVLDSQMEPTGKTLKESCLRENDILVLAIERNEGFIHGPKAHHQLKNGDKLIVYGRLENMEKLFSNSKKETQ